MQLLLRNRQLGLLMLLVVEVLVGILVLTGAEERRGSRRAAGNGKAQG